MRLISENIRQFKRGQSVKNTLEIGYGGLPGMFDELLKIPYLMQIDFDRYSREQKGVDYITFQIDAKPQMEYDETDFKDEEQVVEDSGLTQYLETAESMIEENMLYIEYNVKERYKMLFRRYIDNFGHKLTKHSEYNDVLVP